MLDVYLHRDRVGVLERRAQAKLRFTYEAEWVAGEGAPISIFLPVRERPFEDDAARAFFAGLLPEGELLRSLARAFGTSARNALALLDEIGGECAGAISITPEGRTPPWRDPSDPRPLDDSTLRELLVSLPGRPLLAGGEDGIRLSLAGAQDKTALLLDGTRLAISYGEPPTSHIIKTPIRGLDDTVANEAFCMALAARLDLRVADAVPREVDGAEYLLVRRYDREQAGGGVRRIHQEDICQALGVLPESKYEADGGPGASDCASLLDRVSEASGLDRLGLLDAFAFNFLIGNADAHAKNLSLLHVGHGRVRLAPLYDLISTAAYEGLHRKMAMKLGGEDRPEWVRSRHWNRLASDLGLAAPGARRRVLRLAERFEAELASGGDLLPSPWLGRPVIERIGDRVAERIALVRRELSPQAPHSSSSVSPSE